MDMQLTQIGAPEAHCLSFSESQKPSLSVGIRSRGCRSVDESRVGVEKRGRTGTVWRSGSVVAPPGGIAESRG